MRQRSKQATYGQKMSAQPKVPNRVSREVVSGSKPAVHASRVKVISADDAPIGGKMTKYISLDDIPDGMPTYSTEFSAAAETEELTHGGGNAQHDSYTSAYSNRVGGQVFHSQPNSVGKPSVGLGDACTTSYNSNSIPPPLPRNVLRSSPISIPNEEKDDNSDAGDDWDDPAQYQSPPIRQEVLNHETEKHLKERSNGSTQHKTSFSSRSVTKTQANLAPCSSADGKGGLHYDKGPRKVEYRPYTLSQYKAINSDSYVEYGKLKPDLNTDELKAKRANADRVKEFSKNLNSFNREKFKDAVVENYEGGGDRPQNVERKSAREKAKAFSLHIPKPKIKQTFIANVPSGQHEESKNGYGSAAEEYCISSVDKSCEYGVFEGGGGNSRLQELQEKHGENKKKADAIKKSLGLL